MSDTPRMESAAGHAWGIVDAGILTEGMKLERELNAANERIKRLEEKIKELKRSGDALVRCCDPFTYMDWNRAKEAKP